MHRRDVLRAVVAGSVFSVAGCTGSSGEAEPFDNSSRTPAPVPGSVTACSISASDDGVETTPVTADGRFPDADAVVGLRWNARSQRTVSESEDAYIGSEADAGQKFVVFGLEVTNATDSLLTVDEYNFELAYETPNTVGTAQSAIDGIDEIDFQVKSGGTVRGGLTFVVPVNATAATLRPATPGFADRVAFAFRPQCDRALSIGIPPL